MKIPAGYKRLRPIHLVAVIFFTVSGGPYGLEPLLSYAGSGGALLLLVMTPILWDLPTIFTVLELNSMMPVTGGYYQWVKRALGKRWGFFEGWWTWLYTFVDLAIYPVLFVEYASFFIPQLQAYKIPVCLTIIWCCAGLNILGIVPVGRTALLLGVVVLAPFLILFILSLLHTGSAATFSSLSFRGHSFPSFGMALYTIMWNFIGWDSSTTYAEEVEQPVRSYLVSTLVAFVLVIFVYLITVVTAARSGVNLEVLRDQGFPVLGQLVAGKWLGALIALGGMASTLGLFCAVLLSVSRVPEVMAEDHLLPQKLHVLHPRYKTPYVSIILCASIVSFMILWTFGELLIIDITIYGAGLFLEYIALLALRKSEPLAPRPFRIPLNNTGLSLMLLLPVAVYGIALAGAFVSGEKSWIPAVFAIALLLSAELLWKILTWWRPYLVESKK